jgi:hypothetical protein
MFSEDNYAIHSVQLRFGVISLVESSDLYNAIISKDTSTIALVSNYSAAMGSQVSAS